MSVTIEDKMKYYVVEEQKGNKMIKLLMKLEREIKKWRKSYIENKQERLVTIKYNMAIKERKIDKEIAYLETLKD